MATMSPSLPIPTPFQQPNPNPHIPMSNPWNPPHFNINNYAAPAAVSMPHPPRAHIIDSLIVAMDAVLVCGKKRRADDDIDEEEEEATTGGGGAGAGWGGFRTNNNNKKNKFPRVSSSTLPQRHPTQNVVAMDAVLVCGKKRRADDDIEEEEEEEEEATTGGAGWGGFRTNNNNNKNKFIRVSSSTLPQRHPTQNVSASPNNMVLEDTSVPMDVELQEAAQKDDDDTKEWDDFVLKLEAELEVEEEDPDLSYDPRDDDFMRSLLLNPFASQLAS